jgi:hypothetical protein
VGGEGEFIGVYVIPIDGDDENSGDDGGDQEEGD